MTDAELLRLAALTAGIDYDPRVYAAAEGEGCLWNPLDDDVEGSAEALRLAVKLGMRIDQMHLDGPRVMVGVGDWWCVQQYNGDRLKATRRAIVLAAAEIGKSLEAQDGD